MGGGLNIFAWIALLGWIPAVFMLFALLPARRAVIAAFVLAWLFLPIAAITFTGLPDYTKVSATSVGTLLAALLFDGGRLVRFRPRWFDLPALALVVSGAIASLTNDLGFYDAASVLLNYAIGWGIPYFLGRVYFSDLEGIRELAIGVFLGGLVYLPFVCIELVMSPQLHRWVYGRHIQDFVMTYRLGGWRPTVFMQHGLAVAMWMTGASVCGVWLWASGSLKRLFNLPMNGLVPALLVVTVLCKSINGITLLAGGLGALLVVAVMRTRLALVLLVAAAPSYMLVRTLGLWDGSQAVELVSSILGEGRAGSLDFRLRHEAILLEKALERPVFGWGGWGRSRVRNEAGEDISVTDGLWVISFGTTGLFGLSALTLIFLLPLLLLVWYHPPPHWLHPALAAPAALAVLLALYMLDNLMNAMVNPIFTMASGGVLGLQALRNTRAASHAVPLKPLPLPARYGASAS